MSTLKHILFSRTNFTQNIPILLLQPPQLLNQLILIKIQLQLILDLVIKRRRIMVMMMMKRIIRNTLVRILQKPLQQLNFIFIRPQPLKQPSRFIQRHNFPLFCNNIRSRKRRNANRTSNCRSRCSGNGGNTSGESGISGDTCNGDGDFTGAGGCRIVLFFVIDDINVVIIGSLVA
ncbi:hypothetical protein HanRHA438_Chr14g0658571 [Helianthus annuus]|nr:hypothetical protein HanIR_Chr14g0702801 [Helianthus annuus]KAJ0854080.1 hypothetical protein HanRHA438_Chr14g0658571 [Helianthus annuus]